MIRNSKLLIAGFVAVFGLGVTGVAHAQDDAANNVCWGQIVSHMGSNGMMGVHSNRNGFFISLTFDSQGHRTGVGNVSSENHGELSEGGQGQHAIDVDQNFDADAHPFFGQAPEVQALDSVGCTSPGASDIVDITPN